MSVWLAALCMTVLLGAVAGIAFSKGMHQWKHMDLRPHRTISTLRDDVDWAKEHAHSH